MIGKVHKLRYPLYRFLSSMFPRRFKRWALTPFMLINAYFNLYALRRTPVIVYQMGKVGSKSVQLSLQAHNVFTVHTHSLDIKHIHYLLNECEPDQVGIRIDRVRMWRWVYNHIVKRGEKAQYITLVREPISRSVSDYFENLKLITGHSDPLNELSLDQLHAHFHSDAIQARNRSFLQWFDRQIGAVLGIDVYKYPFPHDQGYLRIIEGNVDLLIMRTETDDAVKEKCIAEFLGMESFELTRRNVGSEKGYSDTYRDFKDQLVLPDSFIDLHCQSKLMRHFYTPDEIEQARAIWTRQKPEEGILSE